eukprot:TRINITY_DN1244_c0_g1_i1.p1 TRINITY_DN1244_c0_g1~~TRINITY_DN1244_c0_g1_i1.p1  ORF type:complete len:636 (+),score=57.93 TRINITY_DN1244_c0_g1_i1:96-2003(+)
MRSLWLVHLCMLDCALFVRHSQKTNGTSILNAETEVLHCSVVGMLLLLNTETGRAAIGLDPVSPVRNLNPRVDLHRADDDRRPHEWRGNKYFWEDDFHYREVIPVGKTLSDNVDVVKFQDGKSLGIAKVVYGYERKKVTDANGGVKWKMMSRGTYENEERLASFAQQSPARFLNPLRDNDLGFNIFADVEKSTLAYLSGKGNVVYQSLQHGQEVPKDQWKNVRFVPSRIITKKREYTNFRMYLFEKAKMSLRTLVRYELERKIKLTLLDKVRLMAEVLDAVDILHRNDVFHSSLSADHVLIFKGGLFKDEFYHAKLCSFSKSRKPSATDDEAERVKMRHKDLWDLGLVFHKLLYGSEPRHTSPQRNGLGFHRCLRSLGRTITLKKGKHEAKLLQSYKDIPAEQSKVIDSVMKALREADRNKQQPAASILRMLKGGFPDVTLGDVEGHAKAPEIWNRRAVKEEPKCTQQRSSFWVSFMGGESQPSSLLQRSPTTSQWVIDAERCPDVKLPAGEQVLQVVAKICLQENSSRALPKPFDDPEVFNSLTHVGPFSMTDLLDDPEATCEELLEYLSEHTDVQFLVDVPMPGKEAMEHMKKSLDDVVVVNEDGEVHVADEPFTMEELNAPILSERMTQYTL